MFSLRREILLSSDLRDFTQKDLDWLRKTSGLHLRGANREKALLIIISLWQSGRCAGVRSNWCHQKLQPPPPPPHPNLHPNPPSCIKAGSVNCLAAPLRTPRSAVSEWTKWLMTALRHRACLRQMETGAAADALQHQLLLPSAGLTHQLWAVSCQTVSAWWLVALRVRYRACSPLLGLQEHDESHGRKWNIA